ncbi:putative E3 ubiquitin-protein ligase UNKL isoform X1 [Lethenteron reissneri]|uniref:putative E3 ubiquitin-protein ligase UNKL isoform X1 n=1 Tax=Lethenteron reissneri TaxID=7753 RepID=UPI002AB73DC4|nr:putative E3 ubiquitin-protein ligase UNKL isoform X1 [Lethenteron reissneri]
MPSACSDAPAVASAEKPHHYTYLRDFRTEQCALFTQHKCTQHRPYTCFHWHFANQRRRRPLRRRDGTFSYSPDEYCTEYDETAGACPNGDGCPLLHRTSGDTERKYHLRYYKTNMCVHASDSRGLCTKNGPHCAFAHSTADLRPPVYDIRELQALEVLGSGLASPSDFPQQMTATQSAMERVLAEEPRWHDTNFVLGGYKTEPCRRAPRLCRQGYACPYFHNERDRRRGPRQHKYRSTPCPQVKHGDEWGEPSLCESKDACLYCHTRTEQQFHPEIYKSTKCNDMQQMGLCPRGPFCAFAHVEKRLSGGGEEDAFPVGWPGKSPPCEMPGSPPPCEMPTHAGNVTAFGRSRSADWGSPLWPREAARRASLGSPRASSAWRADERALFAEAGVVGLHSPGRSSIPRVTLPSCYQVPSMPSLHELLGSALGSLELGDYGGGAAATVEEEEEKGETERELHAAREAGEGEGIGGWRGDSASVAGSHSTSPSPVTDSPLSPASSRSLSHSISSAGASSLSAHSEPPGLLLGHRKNSEPASANHARPRARPTVREPNNFQTLFQADSELQIPIPLKSSSFGHLLQSGPSVDYGGRSEPRFHGTGPPREGSEPAFRDPQRPGSGLLDRLEFSEREFRPIGQCEDVFPMFGPPDTSFDAFGQPELPWCSYSPLDSCGTAGGEGPYFPAHHGGDGGYPGVGIADHGNFGLNGRPEGLWAGRDREPRGELKVATLAHAHKELESANRKIGFLHDAWQQTREVCKWWQMEAQRSAEELRGAERACHAARRRCDELERETAALRARGTAPPHPPAAAAPGARRAGPGGSGGAPAAVPGSRARPGDPSRVSPSRPRAAQRRLREEPSAVGTALELATSSAAQEECGAGGACRGAEGAETLASGEHRSPAHSPGRAAATPSQTSPQRNPK